MQNLLITQIGQHQQFSIVTHAERAGERDNTKRPVDNAALLEKVISENCQVVALKTVHIKRVGQIRTTLPFSRIKSAIFETAIGGTSLQPFEP